MPKIFIPLLSSFLVLLSPFLPLKAEITEIENMAAIIPSIQPSNLVLFDMDDTLTDSKISLGTGASRKYIRAHWDQKMHDFLTFEVAKKVPVKAIEEITPFIVFDLQIQKIPVFVFTGRGTNEWYDSFFPDVAEVTQKQLLSAGFDFSLTYIPEEMQHLEEPSIQQGVIYTAPLSKGDYLKKLFHKSGYRPNKVVFIDDKLDQLKSVEKAMQELDIPFVGFWYRRAEMTNRNIDAFLILIQLEALFLDNKVLTDPEARKIRDERDLKDLEILLQEVMKKISS